MAKYFVENKTGRIYTENRAGYGVIRIGNKSSFECFDLFNKKGEVDVTAKQLAESIVNDSACGLTIKVINTPEEVTPPKETKTTVTTKFTGLKSGTSKAN